MFGIFLKENLPIWPISFGSNCISETNTCSSKIVQYHQHSIIIIKKKLSKLKFFQVAFLCSFSFSLQLFLNCCWNIKNSKYCRAKIFKNFLNAYQDLKVFILEDHLPFTTVNVKIWITSSKMGTSQGSHLWSASLLVYLLKIMFCFPRTCNFVKCKHGLLTSMPGLWMFIESLLCANTSKYVTCIFSHILHSHTTTYLL